LKSNVIVNVRENILKNVGGTNEKPCGKKHECK